MAAIARAKKEHNTRRMSRLLFTENNNQIKNKRTGWRLARRGEARAPGVEDYYVRVRVLFLLSKCSSYNYGSAYLLRIACVK